MKSDKDSDLDQNERFAFYKYDLSESKYQYLSPNIFNITGFSPEEINNIGFDTLVSEKIEIRNTTIKTKFNIFSEVSSNYLINTRGGICKVVFDRTFIEIDGEGNKKNAFGVIFEVPENAGNAEENEKNTLLDSRGEFIDFFILAVDTDEKIKFMNNSAFDYIEDKTVNPVGLKWNVCFPDGEGVRNLIKIKEILTNVTEPEIKPFELRLTDGKKRKRFIKSYFALVKEKKRTDSLIVFGRDITGGKILEEKIKIIEELKSQNASKDKLISQISHDLRSPFNSLLGFSEILTTEYDTLTKFEIQEYLQAIYEASKNLFGMITNLLHFSRFQMGRMEYLPVNLKLLRIINKCLSVLKGNAIKKQINVSLEVDKDVEVFADEDMLVSIIQNLISNAIKFTEQSGTVKIAVKWEEGNDYADISVADSGIGISRENLKKIFSEKFYSTPGTDKEFGTGLGLILVREFIEKHNGKLQVESIPGKGSTFHFSLPVVKKASS